MGKYIVVRLYNGIFFIEKVNELGSYMCEFYGYGGEWKSWRICVVKYYLKFKVCKINVLFRGIYIVKV